MSFYPLSNISSRQNFTEIIDDTSDERLISQLKKIGLYEQLLQQKPEAQTAPSLELTGLYSLCQKYRINLVSSGEFSDILDDLPSPSDPIDLALVQNRGEIIREVIE